MLLENINSPNDVRCLNFDQLLQLCKELRAFYVKSVAVTGGHLGASLGVLELTVALHYAFDTPKDRVIWDVGHQAHFHKILTGRRDKIITQRTPGSISGFTKRSESVYDAFGAGHSSTSISAALGMESAKILQDKSNKVIAIIGDGAMTSGMAYEALNNASVLKNNLIVILNDNQMSISPTVGALSKHLADIASSNAYSKAKELIETSINKITGKSFLHSALKTLGQNIKTLSHTGNIFENLGFHYIGPIDGHNMSDLTDIFSSIKKCNDLDKPILLHVLTKKGKGFYSSCNGEEEDFHAVSKFCPETFVQVKSNSQTPTYSKVFAESLVREAHKDNKIVAITAAMPSGTGLDLFKKSFPNRMFDVGIAEQHAVTFAAGMACEGIKPFVAIYSTFLQRAYDQIIHDVAIQNLPVRFAIDRAGLVGEDGPTHAGSFDLAYLGIIPNFVVMAPSDENELSKMVATASAYSEGPISFRYPRGVGVGVQIDLPEILKIGHGRIVQEGNNVAILSLGTRLNEAMRASKVLEENYNIKPTIADARFLKPLDTKLISALLRNHNVIITIEEGSVGGFATQVNNFILQTGVKKGLIVRNLFLPDVFLEHGKVQDLYEQANLNSNAIVSAVTNACGISNVRILTSHKVS